MTRALGKTFFEECSAGILARTTRATRTSPSLGGLRPDIRYDGDHGEASPPMSAALDPTDLTGRRTAVELERLRLSDADPTPSCLIAVCGLGEGWVLSRHGGSSIWGRPTVCRRWLDG